MSKSRKKKATKKRKSDFPNSWAYLKKLKPKEFNTFTFDEVMDGLAEHWETLPGIQLVARAVHLTSGQIKERTFNSTAEVNAFFKKIKRSGQPYHIHCFDSTQFFTAVFNDQA